MESDGAYEVKYISLDRKLSEDGLRCSLNEVICKGGFMEGNNKLL